MTVILLSMRYKVQHKVESRDRILSAAAKSFRAAGTEFVRVCEDHMMHPAFGCAFFPSMAGCIMTARAHADRECQLQVLAGGEPFSHRLFCTESASEFLEALQ